MKFFVTILFSILLQFTNAQVVLEADGPGDTYELITSVLAPGANPIEAPDCNHESFGEHIDEIFDEELGINVFRFHLHTTPDNDRCRIFDRQRNEIKSYDKSPDNLLGIVGEKVTYKWKFKLADGFQSSPNFTHLHQLKSVGGDLESMPIYTLTTRKGSPDRLELRYAETDNQVTLIRTDLSPFIGNWVEVVETITYGSYGTYDLKIKCVSDGEILFEYSDDSIINWRPGADFVRPKWGIYRSLINDQDLRDEEVLFADFSVEELGTTSTHDNAYSPINVSPNPANNTLTVSNLDDRLEVLQIFSLTGHRVLDKPINSKSTLDLDISSLPSGVYFLHLQGDSISLSRKIVIIH